MRLANCRGSDADRSDAVLRKCSRHHAFWSTSDVRLRPARGAGGLRQSSYIQPTFSRRALARLLTFQSPRAICSARTMQVSLGARPHRSDRSQSPQLKADTRRIVAILLAILAKMPALTLLMGPSCAFRWDLGMYRSEEPPRGRLLRCFLGPMLQVRTRRYVVRFDPDQFRNRFRDPISLHRLGTRTIMVLQRDQRSFRSPAAPPPPSLSARRPTH